MGGISGVMLLVSVNMRFATEEPATEAENWQIYGIRLQDSERRAGPLGIPDKAVKLMECKCRISECAAVTGSWHVVLFARALSY